MNLKTYLKKTGTTTAMLAAKIAVAQSYVSQLALMNRRPSPDLALKIEQATNGEVTRMELLYPELEKEAGT